MRSRNLKTGTAVRVHWLDSMSHEGWQYDFERPAELARICTIGYVVNSKKEALVLTTSIGNKGGALSPVSIPWKSIVKCDVMGRSWDR